MLYNIYVIQKTKIKFSKISRKWRAVFALILFLVAGAAGAFLIAGERSTALTYAELKGEHFKAGNIISDDMFYNNNSMTAAQIQAFLDSKNPGCDPNGLKQSGTWSASLNRYLTRAESGLASGQTLPYVCLKDFSGQAPDRPVDAYCKGYTAATQTAAEMIKGVSDSCGVNPQVLIVLLQKEQSLVTDEWPWANQYKKATGFACPDDAPCNDAFGGFFMQVWMAARQYRVYRQSSTFQANGWYKVGQNNQIQYNPNASCGKATVFIENQATQGLYYYTPYVPNAAALANLHGTGDSCSAYGNRNFWRLFWQWFGDPHAKVSNVVTVPNLPEGVSIELAGASLYTLDEVAAQLSQVGHGSTLAQVLEDVTLSGNVTAKMTKNGKEITTVATGAVIGFYADGVEVASWTVSVMGDVTGDGLVDIADLVALNRHLTKVALLTGEYQVAGDILSENSEVDIADLVRLVQFLARTRSSLR
jgi:hypothetical protein